MTAARPRPEPTSSLHALFQDGTFELGERQSFEVVAEDFPTEYSAGQYLAVATLGRPVAVGTVHLPVPSRIELPYGGGSADGWTVYELGLAIVPGRGVWQVEPVFDDWIEPHARVTRVRTELAKLLGRDPGSLALSTAYLPVLGREIAATRPRTIEPGDVYSPTVFADPMTQLRPSATPEAVDELVARILEVGDWVDLKSDDHLELVEEIPTWLAALLERND